MVELVDTRVLEARTSGVRVQVPLPAPNQILFPFLSIVSSDLNYTDMKKDFHPEVKALTVTCSCGHHFVTSSTIKSGELKVEACSKCHPFYTGEQKLVKTSALDKFYARQAKAQAKQQA